MFPDDLNNWKKEDFDLVSKMLNQKKVIDVELIKKELKDIIFVEDFLEKM